MNETKTNKEKLIVFDTTLRDGEQSAGAAMTAGDKMEIALLLEELGVDIIEAGFPIASEGDWHAVEQIARTVKNSTVCGLARANPRDVEAALGAIKPALENGGRARLHTFIATSPVHMEKKLGLKPDEVVCKAVAAVKQAREVVEDVEFSMEDAGRSELDFLCKIVEATIDAGASTINIPDTVGYTLPDEFAALVRNLMERVPNSDKAVFSVHCHNDLGLAVANSLAAVQVGARQVECTINGIGERAGNAALEEIVMAINTREQNFPCVPSLNCAQLVPLSKKVSQITGMAVQPNKAIVGENAFAHESGIHQDGMLKSRETYEIMQPEHVGWQSNRIPLGKLSGRNALAQHMKRLGKELDTNELGECFRKFKELADTKRYVTDDDLLGICAELASTKAAA